MSAKNGRQEKDQHMDYSRKKWVNLDDAETRKILVVWNEEGEGHINF